MSSKQLLIKNVEDPIFPRPSEQRWERQVLRVGRTLHPMNSPGNHLC
jgi:hypothetical protein